MLTITRVTTLSTVSSGYSELYCRSGARSVASRKSGGAVSGSCRKTMERSGARSGNGAGTGFITGAGFPPQYSVISIVFTMSYFLCMARLVHFECIVRRICRRALSACVQ